MVPALPYSIVITNLGTTPIIAISVRFSLRTGGNIVNKDFFYHSFASRKPILVAGQSQIMTPIRRYNDIAASRPHRTQNPQTEAAKEQQSLSMFESAQEVHIIVDMVMSADGRTAGADQAGMLAKTLDQLKGTHDLAGEMSLQIKNGASDSELTTLLASFTNKSSIDDMYTGTQDNLARMWIENIRPGNRAAVEATVLRMSSVEDRTYTFLKSVQYGGLK
jgi:hypothetical protein